MPILNPIDKLIHDLAQQRAKVYRERALHLKAQQEQQRKAGEAHEKKQLEFMRSAGIKVDEIEQDLKEESRKLKSYLEQTRSHLISRPAMGLADAKHAANIAANFGGLSHLIPPYAGLFYPPDGTEVLPVIPSKIKIKYQYSGSGWGWGLATGSATSPPAPAEVAFYFVPDQNARYSFTASFAFHGFYILKADDGTFTSKDASVTLGFSLQAFQIDDRAPKPFPSPIDRESQNINDFVNFDQVLNFNDAQDFRQGDPVVVVASITIDANARGDGSYAEINFADGDANYIEPQYLWVTKITG